MSACAYGVLVHIMGWIVLFDRFEKLGVDAWIKRIALIGSVVMSVWYGHQVGWSASAQLVFMVCVYCIGRCFELSFSLWDVLGLTGMVMLLHEPSMMHDLGFQLSFAAVIGIGMFGQYAHRFTSKSQPRLVNGAILSIGMTIGATLGTLPICAWTFQSIPLIGVISNLLVTPLLATLAVPLSMLGLMTNIFEYSTMSMMLFVIADACVELSMWLMEPLMMASLMVAFDVLDVCLAFGSSIIGGGIIEISSDGLTAGLMGGGFLWINTPHGSMYHSYVENHPGDSEFYNWAGDAILIRWKRWSRLACGWRTIYI